MKAIKLVVLTVTLLAAASVFADQKQDRQLWVAIDDGTENGSLFVNLDGELRNDAITIYSNNELDETTKEKIETVLSLSGHTGDVIFVGRNRISLTEINGTD
ncbi:MAG: hypothetical protein GXP15_06170 [Gammaproteobacteria bacterium]|nr:hypothetical protein [Gammaproteobacteria bacterium]